MPFERRAVLLCRWRAKASRWRCPPRDALVGREIVAWGRRLRRPPRAISLGHSAETLRQHPSHLEQMALGARPISLWRGGISFASLFEERSIGQSNE
jgi:hypothetical protein